MHSHSESKLKFEQIQQNLAHGATKLFAHLLALIQKLLRTFK